MPCRKCDGCKDNSHHWLPACCDEYDYECKHCDAIGNECRECWGDGCDECDHEGVVWIAGGHAKEEK